MALLNSMSETLKSIAEEIWDHQAEVHDIIWIAGQAHSQSWDFQELIDSEPEFIQDALGIDFDEIDQDAEEVYEHCASSGKEGFCVCVTVPVPNMFKPNGEPCGWSASRRAKWFYVESLDELKGEIKALDEKVIESELKRHDAKAV